MCDPITIGASLVGASTIANKIASDRVDSARNDALEAERIRQAGLRGEADAVNNQSVNRYQDFTGQEDAKAKSLGDFYKSQTVNGAQAATPTEMAPSSSNVVNQETAAQTAKAKDFTNRTGDALGRLRAFGDTLGGISRLQARDAGQIGTLGSFMKGSQGVLPYELDHANQAGGAWKTFADLGQGLGSLFITGGLIGPGAAAAAPAAAGGTGVTMGSGGVTGVTAPSGALRFSSLFG